MENIDKYSKKLFNNKRQLIVRHKTNLKNFIHKWIEIQKRYLKIFPKERIKIKKIKKSTYLG